MPKKYDQSMAEDLAVFVARGGRIAKWAEEKRISSASAFRLHRKPGVQKRISELRADMTSAGVGIGSEFVSAAVATMVKMMRSEDTPAAVQLSAATALVNSVIRLKASGEQEARLVALEAEVRALKGEQP